MISVVSQCVQCSPIEIGDSEEESEALMSEIGSKLESVPKSNSILESPFKSKDRQSSEAQVERTARDDVENLCSGFVSAFFLFSFSRSLCLLFSYSAA